MGTPQPPNKPGVACPLCFGPGTKFGDHDPPYYISAFLHMIQPGEFWIPGDEQLLLSHHLLPPKGPECQWKLTTGDYVIELSWNVLGTLFSVANTATGRLVFMVESDDFCQDELSNDIDDPAGVQAFLGTVSLTWNQKEVG